jgi:hypothetical protein
LTFTAVGSNPDRDFGLCYVRKLSSKFTERRWVLRYMFMPEIIHGRAPEVFLLQ